MRLVGADVQWHLPLDSISAVAAAKPIFAVGVRADSRPGAPEPQGLTACASPVATNGSVPPAPMTAMVKTPRRA
jgi:hypothetical protein